MPKSTPERIIDRAYGDVGRATAYATAPAGGSSSGGADAFLDLSDTPNSFAGQGGRFLAVASGEASVLFRAVVDGDIPNTLVRTARTLTGGDGIDTIGDLSTDRTINVDATVARTSTEIVAGAGLTGGGDLSASRTINVGAGAGLTVNANEVALTTPGSLSATSTNSATGSHTHAIDATIARSAIQINSGSGLTGGGDLTTNRTLNVGAGTGITVNSDDVAVNQAYAFAWTANHSWTGNLQHPDYASQTTNWRITSAGAADFRYLFADEMHVKSFIADLEQALAGGQIISKSVAVLSRNFTAPAAGGTATLYVWDLPSAEDMAVFQSGDLVRLRSFSRASGSLTVADCWGVVTSYSNLTGKEQSWTFTRSAAPNAGGISSGAVIAADSLVLDYGTTGNGFHEVNAIDGLYGANSPYAQTVTWSGHPASGQTVRTRTGNLTGLAFPSQPANEYGFYAGNGRQVADQYVRISTWGSELHNLPLNLYSAGVSTISINPSHPSTGKPAVAVGVNADNVTYYANEGVFMGLEGGGPAWRVGDPSGDYIGYINGVLTVRGRIEVTEGDLGASPYRIATTMASVQTEYESSQYVQFVPSSPHDYGSGICGKITMADGSVYWLKVDTADSLMNRSGSRSGYLTVKKGRDTGENPNSIGSVDYPDQTNATGYTPVVYVYAYNLGDYDILSSAQKNNRLIIADLWMSPDISEINSIVWRSPSQMTVITPEYIRTPNLAVIANGVLGPITAGSIEVGSINKLWLNVNDDDLKLAIGPNATGRSNAPFRVYETGRTIIGDTGGSYIEWNSPNLSIVGNVVATSGELVNLSVSGTVSVGNDGKIAWANGDGFLDRFGIYYAEKVGSSLAAVLRVGRPAPFAQGMIDVDMFAQADSQWDYAFHVTDGGNSNNSYSALYHGQSAVPGTAAVDRIFNAYTTNAGGGSPFSDGYYSDLAAGQWLDFDSSGVSFRGVSRGGQPVAVFQQVGGGAAGPVVFAGSDQANRAVFYAEIVPGIGQTAFHVDQNGGGANSFIGLNTNGGKIQMGNGDIESIGQIAFRLGGGISGTTPMVSGSAGWVRVWLDGDNRNFYVPLYTNGTTH
jgi:hypothetical protein